MENRFSFLTKEKGQWCALRYYGIRKCISYSATDQDKNRDKLQLAQRQKCFKQSAYFFIPIKFWLFFSEIKIFLIIAFKLSMKLFVHKIYYTQDDDSLFLTIANESDNSAYTFFILKAFPVKGMEPPGWLSKCLYESSRLRIINDILITAPSNNLSATNIDSFQTSCQFPIQ